MNKLMYIISHENLTILSLILINLDIFFRKDASMIFLFIGHGFYLQCTHDEALKIIDKKVKNLSEKSDQFTQDANKVKATIKITIEVNFIDMQFKPFFLHLYVICSIMI